MIANFQEIWVRHNKHWYLAILAIIQTFYFYFLFVNNVDDSNEIKTKANCRSIKTSAVSFIQNKYCVPNISIFTNISLNMENITYCSTNVLTGSITNLMKDYDETLDFYI